MGGKISIDKHVSNLEEILEMNPKSFSKLKFENKIPDSITQHIKVKIISFTRVFLSKGGKKNKLIYNLCKIDLEIFR